MKTVSVVGHAFDCLPGHVTISARGQGSSVRVAVKDAIDELLLDEKLKHKHIGDFKLSVVVIKEGG